MSAPSSPPRRVAADTRREQILATAEALFVARGFEGVGMNDIARALGTSRPTVYTYFTSTGAMLHALLDARLPRLWTRLHPLLEAARARTPGGPAAVDFAAVFRALLDERELLLLLHSGGGPVFREQRAQVLADLARQLAPYRPGPDPAPADALHLVIVLLEAAAVDALRDPRPPHPALPELVARFVAGGAAALRGPDPAG